MKLSNLNHVRGLVRDRQRIANAIGRAKARMEELPVFIAAQEAEIKSLNEKIVAAFGADVDFDFDSDDFGDNIRKGAIE